MNGRPLHELNDLDRLQDHDHKGEFVSIDDEPTRGIDRSCAFPETLG